MTQPASLTDRSRLWFVGSLPPPLNGQSNANLAMLDNLTERRVPLALLEISGTGLTKVLRTVLAAMRLVIEARATDRAYLSVPGQRGVWLFVLIAAALRLRKVVNFVHHHSFRPINRGPSAAMRSFVIVGGACQHHVLLSDNMRRRFAELYLKDEDRATTLSNAYLFSPRLAVTTRPNRPVTLGHMSVLTREKGLPYLLELFARLSNDGADWRLVIAGPCCDQGLNDLMGRIAAQHPGRIDLRGPVDGAAKEQFFADIDLFVLPTTLVDEAEPLVMVEAFGRGVDVVATDTGCIRDRVMSEDHLLQLDPDVDVRIIRERVTALRSDWQASRTACVNHARAIKVAADAEAGALFPRLSKGI